MSTEQQLFCYTLPAAGDLTGKVNLFVKVDTAGRIAVATGGGDNAIGVLQSEASAIDLAVAVAVLGIAKVIVGSAGVTAGDIVQADTAGKAVTTASAKYSLGVALDTGVSGDVIRVLLVKNPLKA